MKIAILTRPDYRSPRVLAESLKIQLEDQGIDVKIFEEINVLSRLVSCKKSNYSFHFWLQRKLTYFFKDKKIISELKKFDAVIVSECAPNGFLKSLYNVEHFKRILQKPVGVYEVYYLGNAPTQLENLRKNNEAYLSRYDFHLSVSAVTEIKCKLTSNWYPIGINAQSWGIKPMPKKELVAILDFVFPGNEKIRESQISALEKADIKYIILDRPYTFTEIRQLYQQSAIYFMQSYEAFGLPLLECICGGAQVFTPASWWPMSWRLNENPTIHGEGTLPACFTLYDDEDQLLKKLIAFKENYNLAETPKLKFNELLAHYPDFYKGNVIELKRMIADLNSNTYKK